MLLDLRLVDGAAGGGGSRGGDGLRLGDAHLGVVVGVSLGLEAGHDVEDGKNNDGDPDDGCVSYHSVQITEHQMTRNSPYEGAEGSAGGDAGAVAIQTLVPEAVVEVAAAEGARDVGSPGPTTEPEDAGDEKGDDVGDAVVELLEPDLESDHATDDDPRVDGLRGKHSGQPRGSET